MSKFVEDGWISKVIPLWEEILRFIPKNCNIIDIDGALENSQGLKRGDLRENNVVVVDLCAYRYEVDDSDVNNHVDVLMTIVLMNIEVGGDIVPTIWWWG